MMKKRKYRKKRKHYEYSATAKICNRCHLREQCTRSKTGRTLKRHVRQDDIDEMLTQAISTDSKKDIQTRQHLMERSFARATRYGYKRARWRRLWRVQSFLLLLFYDLHIRHSSTEPARPLLRNKLFSTGHYLSVSVMSCPPRRSFSEVGSSWNHELRASSELHKAKGIAFRLE
jgi:hypothetical protein